MLRQQRANIVESIPADVWACLTLDEQSFLLLLDDRLNGRIDNTELRIRRASTRQAIENWIKAGQKPIGWMPGGTP